MNGGINPQILFIDDEQTIVEAAKALLAQEGFDVLVFQSPAAIFDAIKDGRCSQPSCIVIDWELPEMTGEKLYQKVCRQVGEIPVVFISGYEQRPSMLKSSETPAVFVKKPFRFHHLAQTIKSLISQGGNLL